VLFHSLGEFKATAYQKLTSDSCSLVGLFGKNNHIFRVGDASGKLCTESVRVENVEAIAVIDLRAEKRSTKTVRGKHLKKLKKSFLPSQPLLASRLVV